MKQEALKYKKIEDQVIVITGASSGIGLATAKMAAKKGARVVLASRNAEDLEKICEEIRAEGGEALAVTADVSKLEDVEKIRDLALRRFHVIDTWVNNAAASIFGKIVDTPLDEAKQLFETNFWGLHYGCMVALKAMQGNEAGMIINLGSEVSERAFSLQAMYSASKHAVKGYTEALRTELEKDGVPVGLTLVRPAAIDTPFTQHAANHLDKGEPSLPAPVYHPDIAASAIIQCAQNGKRDVYIGGASKIFSKLENIAPRLIDLLVEGGMDDQQRLGAKIPHTEENEGLMHAPEKEGLLRGGHKGYVMKTSLWTAVSLNPWISTMAIAGLSVAAAGLFVATRKSPGENDASYAGGPVADGPEVSTGGISGRGSQGADASEAGSASSAESQPSIH